MSEPRVVVEAIFNAIDFKSPEQTIADVKAIIEREAATPEPHCDHGRSAHGPNGCHDCDCRVTYDGGRAATPEPSGWTRATAKGTAIDVDEWDRPLYVRAATPEPSDLRAAVLTLCDFAGRFSAGDTDVDRSDLQVAIDEARAALDAHPPITEAALAEALHADPRVCAGKPHAGWKMLSMYDPIAAAILARRGGKG